MVEVIAFGEAVALAEKGGVSREIAVDVATGDDGAAGSMRPVTWAVQGPAWPVEGIKAGSSFSMAVRS